MANTFHPISNRYRQLVNAYQPDMNGVVSKISETVVDGIPVAAGGFISTAADMVIWNECLHNGTLISKNTYSMMIGKHENAIRKHPLFGETYYGYGVTVDDNDGILQVGQTGYVPGFVSMNFYFPATKTSAVVFSNFVRDASNIKNAFYYHLAVLESVKLFLKKRVGNMTKPKAD